MAAAKGLEDVRAREAFELNSKHCDETPLKNYERDTLRIQNGQKEKPTISSGRRNHKQIGFATTCSVPGYKESCTSVFTEEFRLTGKFCPSISGIVTAPVVDSRATARFDIVDVTFGCRARL